MIDPTSNESHPFWETFSESQGMPCEGDISFHRLKDFGRPWALRDAAFGHVSVYRNLYKFTMWLRGANHSIFWGQKG